MSDPEGRPTLPSPSQPEDIEVLPVPKNPFKGKAVFAQRKWAIIFFQRCNSSMQLSMILKHTRVLNSVLFNLLSTGLRPSLSSPSGSSIPRIHTPLFEHKVLILRMTMSSYKSEPYQVAPRIYPVKASNHHLVLIHGYERSVLPPHNSVLLPCILIAYTNHRQDSTRILSGRDGRMGTRTHL